MDALDQLIAQETAKLRVLESEVVARKQRIQTLRSMRENSDLDAVLADKIKPAQKPEQQQLPEVAVPIQIGRSKHGDVKRTLLALLNTREPTHLKTLIEGMARTGRQFDNKRMRAEMWYHKKDGLVTSDEPGWFKLTEHGQAFLEGQKGETAVGAAVSGATTSVEDEL